MTAPVRTGTRTMDTIDLPVRSGSNISGEESSGSSGTLLCCGSQVMESTNPSMVATSIVSAPSITDSLGPTEDRVRKFQKTTEHGSRLRKASASNAMSAARPPPAANNTTTTNANSALRARNKVPLGPRERPQDFSKPRSVAARNRMDHVRRVLVLTCCYTESSVEPAWLPARVVPSCRRSPMRPPRAQGQGQALALALPIHASASPSSCQTTLLLLTNNRMTRPLPIPTTSCPRLTLTTLPTASHTNPI